MENRYQRLLLSAVCYSSLCSMGLSVQAQDTLETEAQQVVNPEVERREITPAAIDTEDFEVGPYVGMLSIEDFDRPRTELLGRLRAVPQRLRHAT